MQQYNEAIAEYNKAIAINSSNASYYNNKGNHNFMRGISLQNLQKHREALVEFENAITKTTQDCNTQSYKGNFIILHETFSTNKLQQ